MAKNLISKFWPKMKILESIVYVISQLIFLGSRKIGPEGRRRNIAESLGKISGNFRDFKIATLSIIHPRTQYQTTAEIESCEIVQRQFKKLRSQESFTFSWRNT